MKRYLLIAVLVVGVCLPAAAQRFDASIRGTVTDESGAVIPGVPVTVTGTATGLTRTTATNESGNYSVGSLPVGTYQVAVEMDGFKSSIVKDLELNVADIREVNIRLELGAITEAITTTASSLSVQTIGGEVAGLITGEQVRELPLNGPREPRVLPTVEAALEGGYVLVAHLFE